MPGARTRSGAGAQPAGGAEGQTQLLGIMVGGMLRCPSVTPSLGTWALKSLPGPQAHMAGSIQPTGCLPLLCVGSLAGRKAQGPGVRPAQVHTLPP